MKQLKISLYFLLLAIITISCAADAISDPLHSELNNTTVNSSKTTNASKVKSKIDVCHLDAVTSTWHTINISINALAGHLAHGDIVPDADYDGYTKVNPCGIGNQDDCDDTNAAINPGAEEILTDDIDNNCDGIVGHIEPVFCLGCQSGAGHYRKDGGRGGTICANFGSDSEAEAAGYYPCN